MSSEPVGNSEPSGHRRIVLAWLPLVAVVCLVAIDSLWQLRQGRTRTIPLPYSRRIYAEELADARASAEMWFVPALAFLGLMITFILA